MRPRNVLPLVPLLLLFLASTLHAQSSGATLQGSVTTETGTALSGATVRVSPGDRSAVTDVAGNFRISGLPAGSYTVSVSMLGFAPVETRARLSGGQPTSVEVVLRPSAVELDAIAVTGVRRRIVSAARSNLEILDLPMSVQIVGQDLIREQQVLSLEGALRNVSGVHQWGSYANAGQIDLNIRGFDMDASATGQNTRLNGTYLAPYGPLYGEHIEEVQVIKGPASVLYGDVTPGGLVNLVTKQPLAAPHRRAEVKVGDRGLFRPAFDLGGPLNPSGTLLYRLNASAEQSDSFRDEVSASNYLVAPAVAWIAGPGTRLTVEGVFRSDAAVMDWGFPAGLTFGQVKDLPVDNFYGYPGARFTTLGRSGLARLEQLAGEWTVRASGQWGDMRRRVHDVYPTWNADDSMVEFGWGDYVEHAWLRGGSAALDASREFATGSWRHDVLIGVDGMTERRRVAADFGSVAGSTSLSDPEWSNVPVTGDAPADPRQDRTTTRFGFNIQDRIVSRGERVALLLGMRVGTFRAGTRYDDDADAPDPRPEATTESAVTPRLGMTWKLTPGATVYGSYATSFEVAAADPARGLPDPEPTRGRQFEVGVKGSWLNDRFGVTVAAFDLERSNVLQFFLASSGGDVSDPSSWVANQTGRHRSRGIEVDWHGAVTPDFTLSGSATALDTEVLAETVQQPWQSEPTDYAGKSLPNNPGVRANVWARYRIPLETRSLSLGMGVFHQGAFWGDKANTEENRIDGNTKLDLAVGLDTGPLELQLNVQNVTNVQSWLHQWNTFWQPQWPRRVVGSVRLAF